MAVKFLRHTCTLQTQVEVIGETDERGNPVYSEVDVEDIRCLFLWQDTEITNERGTAILKTPLLYLEPLQQVSKEYIVKDVYDEDGTTILLKRAKINTIDTTSEGGVEVLQVCQLEGAVI